MATEPAGSAAKPERLRLARGGDDACRGAAQRRTTEHAERVSDALRDLIIQGDLPAGTPLREQSLVETLDVSRNTVREALRLLGRERLVDYHIHRGVAVAAQR